MKLMAGCLMLGETQWRPSDNTRTVLVHWAQWGRGACPTRDVHYAKNMVFWLGFFDWKWYKTVYLTRTTIVAKSVECLSGWTSRLQQVDYGLFCGSFVPYARSQWPFGTSIGTALRTSSFLTTYSQTLFTNISKHVVPTLLKIVMIFWLYVVNAWSCQ